MQSTTESITMLLYLPTKNIWELEVFQKDSHLSYCQYTSWNRSYTLSSWCLQSFRKPNVNWQRIETYYTIFKLTVKFFIDVLCYVTSFRIYFQQQFLQNYILLRVNFVDVGIWKKIDSYILGAINFQGVKKLLLC